MQIDSLLADNTKSFFMPKERNMDINIIKDLQVAQSCMRLKGEV